MELILYLINRFDLDGNITGDDPVPTVVWSGLPG